MANQKMQRCLTSMISREMQIESKMRSHLQHINIATTKIKQNTVIDENVQKFKPLCIAARIRKRNNHYGNQYIRSYKN